MAPATSYPAFYNEFSEMFKVNLAQEQSLACKEILAILNGPTKVRNQYSKGTMQVNITQFFKSPEQDLKIFLPTGFEDSSDTISYRVTFDNSMASESRVDGTNYYKGLPTKWNMAAFKKYFPNASEIDIAQISIIMSSLGIPVASYIQ